MSKNPPQRPSPAADIERTVVQRVVPKPAAAARTKAPAPQAAGSVKHDSRGNAVWNWAVSLGKEALESTSRLLKKLEVPELKVDEKPPGLELEQREQPGGGYDPYNRGRRGR